MLQTCQLLVQVLLVHMEFPLLSNQINPNSISTTHKREILCSTFLTSRSESQPILITSPIYGIRSYELAFGGVLLMVP